MGQVGYGWNWVYIKMGQTKMGCYYYYLFFFNASLDGLTNSGQFC